MWYYELSYYRSPVVILPTRSIRRRLGLGMDMKFHPILKHGCDYLSNIYAGHRSRARERGF